jgi:hypothetical protein
MFTVTRLDETPSPGGEIGSMQYSRLTENIGCVLGATRSGEQDYLRGDK